MISLENKRLFGVVVAIETNMVTLEDSIMMIYNETNRKFFSERSSQKKLVFYLFSLYYKINRSAQIFRRMYSERVVCFVRDASFSLRFNCISLYDKFSQRFINNLLKHLFFPSIGKRIFLIIYIGNFS